MSKELKGITISILIGATLAVLVCVGLANYLG